MKRIKPDEVNQIIAQTHAAIESNNGDKTHYLRLINELVDLHEKLEATETSKENGNKENGDKENGDKESGTQVRVAFLQLIEKNPTLLKETVASHFLATAIKPTDFDELQWTTPVRILDFCKVLYGFQFADETVTKQVRIHVSYLLQRALRHYENTGQGEKLFELVQVAPTSPLMDSAELSRLRYLARSHELQRVRRNARILYGYLAAQAFMVLVVFPFLFIKAENGELQRQVEALTDVKIGDEGYRLFTYIDGLYWSIVTAASIGYGDITPMTTTGKIIAAVLGTMGVVTVGVIAGLVLKWVTPRILD